MTTWLYFIGLMAVIAIAGFELARYGDTIADRAGLSRSWVGLTLIAGVTSLPELATGITSVTAANVPDIAVGDVLGSCVFNLLILVALDFFYRKEPVYSRARQGHVLAAGFGTVLIGFVGLSLLLYQQPDVPALGFVGWYTPLIVLFYAVSARTLFRYEREQAGRLIEEGPTYPHVTLNQAIGRYAIASSIVIAAGIALPFVGEQLAQRMGWSQTFVGTLFVGIATSAPEVAATLAALKLGVLDMAIGGLLGSNLFDIVILAVDDLFFTAGPLLAGVSSAHVASALSATMMNGLATIGLMLRPRSRVLRTVSWVSLFVVAVYLLNVLVLYLHET